MPDADASRNLAYPSPPPWAERRFVVKPLADVRPDLVLPGERRTVREVLKALPARPRGGRLSRKVVKPPSDPALQAFALFCCHPERERRISDRGARMSDTTDVTAAAIAAAKLTIWRSFGLETLRLAWVPGDQSHAKGEMAPAVPAGKRIATSAPQYSRLSRGGCAFSSSPFPWEPCGTPGSLSWKSPSKAAKDSPRTQHQPWLAASPWARAAARDALLECRGGNLLNRSGLGDDLGADHRRSFLC